MRIGEPTCEYGAGAISKRFSMNRSEKFAVVLVIAAIAGFCACFIEWHPDSHTDFTGFPVPLGIVVLLEDGTSDCGGGMAGLVLNPLLFMIAASIGWGGFALIRRIRGVATASK